MGEVQYPGSLDGIYRSRIEPLAGVFSEYGLIQHRIHVEAEYLIALSEFFQTQTSEGVRELTPEEKTLLRGLSNLGEFNNERIADAQLVKRIETKGYKGKEPTWHDVKAVEIMIGDRIEDTSLADITNWIHFGLTSDDVNNLAYSKMLQQGTRVILVPELKRLAYSLESLADYYSCEDNEEFGEEISKYASYINQKANELHTYRFNGKLNGAIGNYNSFIVTYPDFGWEEFSQNFVEKLGLNHVQLTTQILPYQNYVKALQKIEAINMQLADLIIKIGKKEDNTEKLSRSLGNIEFADALFSHFTNDLLISRLQRDLSDSTVRRNFGAAMAYSQVGYQLFAEEIEQMVNPEVQKEKYQTNDENLESLLALNPLDGKYWKKVDGLRPYLFGEEKRDLTGAIKYVILPSVRKIINELEQMALEYKDLTMLGRTHGQPAIPTTFGAELKKKAYEISVEYNNIISLLRKEKIDHTELFSAFQRLNLVLIDYDRDMWRYISDDWISQKPVGTGSSTMAHKINPINFESSEGNLGISVSLFDYLKDNVKITELNPIVEDKLGIVFGYSLVGYKSLLRGLSNVPVNEEKINETLVNNPTIISEGIQQILRREGLENAFEVVKKWTQGQEVSLETLHELIDSLDIDDEVKRELKEITPFNYTGLASLLAERQLDLLEIPD
jgi:adenylosuccinate lyase